MLGICFLSPVGLPSKLGNRNLHYKGQKGRPCGCVKRKTFLKFCCWRYTYIKPYIAAPRIKLSIATPIFVVTSHPNRYFVLSSLAFLSCQQFYLTALGNKASSRVRSAATPYIRPLSSGVQTYDDKPAEFPLTQPLTKLTAKLQVSCTTSNFQCLYFCFSNDVNLRFHLCYFLF